MSHRTIFLSGRQQTNRSLSLFLEEQLLRGTDMGSLEEHWAGVPFTLSDAAVAQVIGAGRCGANALFLAQKCSCEMAAPVLDQLSACDDANHAIASLVQRFPRAITGRDQLIHRCVGALEASCDKDALDILTAVSRYFPGHGYERELQGICCELLWGAVVSCTVSLSAEQIGGLLDLLILSINAKTDLQPEVVARIASELQHYGRSLILFERLFSQTKFQPGEFYGLILRLIKQALADQTDAGEMGPSFENITSRINQKVPAPLSKLIALRVLVSLTRQVPDTLLDFELLRRVSQLTCSTHCEIMLAAATALGEAVCGLQQHELVRLRENLSLVGSSAFLQGALERLHAQVGDAAWLLALGETIGVQAC